MSLKSGQFYSWASLFTILFLTGCLEHQYSIILYPDGTSDLIWRVSGDQYDLFDGMTLFPDSTIWTITREIEEKEDETLYHLTASLSGVPVEKVTSLWDWKTSPADTLYFLPQIQTRRKGFFLIDRYYVEVTFPSRQYNELYGDIWEFIPEECRALEDVERLRSIPSSEVDLLQKKFALGIIQWNRARYIRAFDLVWDIARKRDIPLGDTTSDAYHITRSAWVDDLHTFLNQLDVPKPEIVNLDWWSDLRPQFIGHFADILPHQYLPIITDIANALERGYLITRDMQDDRFTFHAQLPGFILHSNGTRLSSRQVEWRLNGKELQNRSAILYANSLRVRPVPAVAILGFIVGAIMGLLYRKNTSKANLRSYG